MSLLSDVRQSLRNLARNPGFALGAILAFALGIGANTAIFTIVNAVLLRPLPYKDSGRLVVLQHAGGTPVAPANYLDWKAQSKTLESVASAQVWGPSMQTPEGADVLNGMVTSPNLFELLGVAPMLGRTYTDADESATVQPIVLSHRLWQSRFGGDASVIGRRVVLNNEPYVVAAVMPPSFAFAPYWATRAELWAIHRLAERRTDRGGQSLRIFARLKPGVEIEAARAEIEAIHARLTAEFPADNAGSKVEVVRLLDRTAGPIRPTLLALLAMVGFVLLIACANAGNLLLVRTTARRQELAVRQALGAGTRRILQGLLVESATISLIGGATGLGLALLALQGLSRLLPPHALPRQAELSLDPVVFAYCALLSLAVGVLAGLLPVWHATRANLRDVLQQGGRGMAGSTTRHRLRSALVASEVALSIALLVAAGLTIRSFRGILSEPPGFDPQGVLTLEISPGNVPEGGPGRRIELYRRINEQVRSLPGVAWAGLVNHIPIAGDDWGTRFHPEGKEVPKPGQSPAATWRVATPGYFETMRIRMVEGRAIRESDRADSPSVVVVNETLARRHFPGTSAVGKRIALGTGESGSPTWVEIVGVFADMKQRALTLAPNNEIFQPVAQSASHRDNPQRFWAAMTVVVRARERAEAAALANGVKQAIWSINRAIPISQVATMESVMADALWRQRLTLVLTGGFSFLALILAVTGIYAVVSSLIAERTRDIGIRVALGALPIDVLRLALKEAAPALTMGMLAGCGLALALGRVVGSLLYRVRPDDPAALAMATAAMLACSVAAILIPAFRASRLDPTTALRAE
jgi:predicted permease